MPDQLSVPVPHPPPSAPTHPLPLPPAAVAGDDAVSGAAVLARAALGLALGTLTLDRGGDVGGRDAAAGASRASPREIELRAWAAHEVRQGRVADAVRAYTRVLRGGGVPLAPTMVAVASAVRGHAAVGLPVDARAAVERDAARSCLEAYFGP